MPAPLPPDLRVRSHAVDVYPYRLVGGELEWLLLRRASGVRYAGVWRMVGGKVEGGETGWQAALRELREETGCAPLRAWVIPSANAFYEWQTDRMALLPAFAAELGRDPLLDREHDAFVWLSAEAAAHRLGWPEQRRLLLLANALLREDAVLPEWELPREDPDRAGPEQGGPT